MRKTLIALVAAGSWLPFSVLGLDVNVALGKPVTLDGDFGTGGWGGGILAPAGSVTDGLFKPQSHQWDQDTVWWDDTLADGMSPTGGAFPLPNTVTVDLLGTFTINSLVVQTDDNDGYLLEYYDPLTASWGLAYDIPAVGGWGMQARPDPSDPSNRYALAAPITASLLRLSGNWQVGDMLFSVAEIQAYGPNGVPDAASTLGLLGLGALALGGVRRRMK